MKKVRLPRSVILITVLYLVAATSAAITLQNWQFLKTYIPFLISTAILIASLHRRVHFSHLLLWSLTIWGATHLAGGLVRIPETWNFQGTQPLLSSWLIMGTGLKYHYLTQTFGFGACTWLTWEALRASIQIRLGRKLYPSMGMIFLCVFAGMGLSATSEIIEFATLHPQLLNNPQEHSDTYWGLLASLTGCLSAGILILFRG